MAARFLALEGGEASGKSTQAARLARRLDAVLTREPGGTVTGTRLRELLLDPATDLSSRAEMLVLLADRAQHVAEVIRPALTAGRHVVTDRYAGSSLAYQGYGRGLPLEDIRRMSGWASSDLWPDLTVLLDVPLAAAAARQSGGLDRLEAAGKEFHQKVVEGFRLLAADDPAHWVVVDGTLTPDEVEQALWTAVTDRLPDLASG